MKDPQNHELLLAFYFFSLSGMLGGICMLKRLTVFERKELTEVSI